MYISIYTYIDTHTCTYSIYKDYIPIHIYIYDLQNEIYLQNEIHENNPKTNESGNP